MKISNRKSYGLLVPVIRIVLVAVLIAGCTKDEPVEPVPETLISADKLFGRTQGEIKVLVNAAGLNDLTGYIRYDINIYTVTYKTLFLGNEITASGLVSFPETTDAIPVLSFQHGTISKHSEAPTSDIATYGFLSSLASAGYILAVPDLIGFGSSSDQLHPYYHEQSTAEAVIDLMKAAKELAARQDISFDGNVFLAGYSEGGYATMAAHKTMEEDPPAGFHLVASAPAAGGYDLAGMRDYFFSLETYDDPYYLAFVAMSYKTVYGYDQLVNDIFKEPYASAIPGYFHGTLTGSQINNKLTRVIADLVKPELLEGIHTEEKYSYINDAFRENSLNDWIPEVRMYMYHGTIDTTVPFQNSQDTYDKMRALGASPDIVTLTPLEGYDHGGGVFPYISDFIREFDSLK